MVETRLRAGGGDVVHRAWVVPGPPPALVVDVADEGPVPVAVAMVVDGARTLTVDGARVDADGVALLHGPGRPGRILGAPEGLGAPAAVWPVVHGGRVRILVPLGDAAAEPPTHVPDAEAVARGFAAQAAAATRAVLPDGRFASALARAGRALLVAEGADRIVADPFAGPDPAADAAVVDALSALGHADTAAGALAALAADHGPAPDVLAAAAAHVRRHDDRFLAAALVDVVAEGLAGPSGARLAGPAAVLLAAAGDRRAAADAARRGSPDARPAASPEELDAAAAAVMEGAPLGAMAAFALAALGSLAVADDDRVDVLVVLPPAWRGQPVEVHGLATAAGAVSYAVRWHGEHPALLWEVAPHRERSTLRLSAPGLLAGWSTGDLRGEALLREVR